MSRKRYTAVPYGVVGDYHGQPPLILSGHLPIDEVCVLPELDSFARAHSELPTVFSSMHMILYPPGTENEDPLEDADETDLKYIRAAQQETQTFPMSAFAGSQSSVICDYYNGVTSPEKMQLDGKRQRFSMVIYGTEGDFLHETVLLLPGAVTLEQARFRPEIKEFAAQHPETPTVFSCALLLFRAPGVAADAPVADATPQGLELIRLYRPEAPDGLHYSGLFQRVEGEADILIGGDNPYYQDPDEEMGEEP